MNLDDATLEQRLRDTYSAVGEAIDLPARSVDFLPLEGGPDGTRGAPQSHRRRAGTAMAAFAAVVVVVVVAVGVVAVNNSSSGRGRRPGNAPAVAPIFPTYSHHQGPSLLLAPSSVPNGFHLVVSTRGDGGASSSGSPGRTVQYWVKLDAGAQQPLASFQVAWGPADLGKADALDPLRSGSVATTVAGHDGLYNERLATVAWEQNGQFVAVSGAMDSWIGSWPEHLSRDDLANIAAYVVRDPDGHYTLTEVPNGFRLSAEEPSYASEGTNARELAFSDGANHGFAIELVDDSQQPPGVTLANPPARLTTIRDQLAVLTPYLNEVFGCTVADYFLCTGSEDLSHRSIIWTEPDNTTVFVTSVGITEVQLLAVAHSLEPVTPDNWPQVSVTTP